MRGERRVIVGDEIILNHSGSLHQASPRRDTRLLCPITHVCTLHCPQIPLSMAYPGDDSARCQPGHYLDVFRLLD